MDAAAGVPARLVLDLVATDRESFLRNMASEEKLARSEAPPPPAPPPAPSTDPRPLVVLDPGHGGIDTGTRAPNGECEKDIVLAFAKRLRDHLEKSGKYRVLMTRDRRYFRGASRPRADRAPGRRRAVYLNSRRFPAA